MKQLVNCAPSADFGGLSFGSLIRTEITLKDGTQAAILTALTVPQMFDAAVMGINMGLKCGDLAECWQNEVFTLCNGSITPFVKYDPTRGENIKTKWEMQKEVADLRETISLLSQYNEKQLNDLIAAHKKIGGLKYLLESHGVEVPEYLK